MRRISTATAILSALLLPLIFTTLWLMRNSQLPANDAANYLSTAVNIYQHFTDQHFWKGILHCYTERGWRPIFFPVFLVPFLLPNGNLYFAFSAFVLIALLLSITYVYLYFRLALERLPAIAATSVIGLLPLFQAQLLMLFAEGALFPLLIGTLYHLIKSNFLTDKKHTIVFAILFSLSLWVRPVEALTDMIFVLGFFIYHGVRQKFFSSHQLKICTLITLVALSLFFISASRKYLHIQSVALIDNGGVFDKKMQHLILSGLIGSFIILFLITLPFILSVVKNSLKFHSKQNYLIPVSLLIATSVIFWYLPFAFETFEWIYRTSLGDVAVGTGSLNGAQFSLNVLMIYLREEGLLPISTVILIAVSTLVLSQKLSDTSLKAITYLLLIAPFPLWEAFYTVQIITRKLSIAFPAFIMALLFIALKEGRWLRVRLVIIGLLAFTQLGLLTATAYYGSYRNPQPFLNNTIGYFIRKPSIIKPNPHYVVMTFLDEQETNYHFKSVGFEVYPGTPDARHPIEAEPFNPFLQSALIAAKRKKYYGNYVYFGTNHLSNLASLKLKYDAIFIADRQENMRVTPFAAAFYKDKLDKETNPSISVFYALLLHYAENSLPSIGWDLGPCIPIKTEEQGVYKGCLIINSP